MDQILELLFKIYFRKLHRLWQWPLGACYFNSATNTSFLWLLGGVYAHDTWSFVGICYQLLSDWSLILHFKIILEERAEFSKQIMGQGKFLRVNSKISEMEII